MTPTAGDADIRKRIASHRYQLAETPDGNGTDAPDPVLYSSSGACANGRLDLIPAAKQAGCGDRPSYPCHTASPILRPTRSLSTSTRKQEDDADHHHDA